MPNVQKDAHHELSDIIEHMDTGKVGRDVGHMMVKAHFEKHGFDMRDVDSKGVPKGVESQMQKWLTHHPQGKRAAAAIKGALPDTLSEKQAMLDHLDSTHEHERTKNPSDSRATKAVDPTTTMSSVCLDELNRMSHALVEKAKRDKINLSFEKAFTAIVTLTEKGRSLAALEKYNRIQV